MQNFEYLGCSVRHHFGLSPMAAQKMWHMFDAHAAPAAHTVVAIEPFTMDRPPCPNPPVNTHCTHTLTHHTLPRQYTSLPARPSPLPNGHIQYLCWRRPGSSRRSSSALPCLTTTAHHRASRTTATTMHHHAPPRTPLTPAAAREPPHQSTITTAQAPTP